MMDNQNLTDAQPLEGQLTMKADPSETVSNRAKLADKPVLLKNKFALVRKIADWTDEEWIHFCRTGQLPLIWVAPREMEHAQSGDLLDFAFYGRDIITMDSNGNKVVHELGSLEVSYVGGSARSG